MGKYTIFQMFENPRKGRQARNFTTNVPKILDLKSSSEQIFSEIVVGCPCLNALYLSLNVRIPCATLIYSSCGLTITRQACCFTFSEHLLKFFLIKPLKRSVGFVYNSSNLDHWISQLQGICGDQQLPRVLRGWCVAQYFPLF